MKSLAGYWGDWQLIIMEKLLYYGKAIYAIIINLFTVTPLAIAWYNFSYHWGDSNCYVCHRLWTGSWSLLEKFPWNVDGFHFNWCQKLPSSLLALKILYLGKDWGVSWSKGEWFHCILLNIITFGQRHNRSIYRSYRSCLFCRQSKSQNLSDCQEDYYPLSSKEGRVGLFVSNVSATLGLSSKY